MRPGYAYLGIGLIFILAAIAFVNPAFMRSRDTVGGTGATTSIMTPQVSFTFTSSAFLDGAVIPSQYTCDVDNPKNPPLSISGTPDRAKSLVLIVEDPDVPKAIKPDGIFLHWLVFDIPASITEIVEGGKIGSPGQNGVGKTGYVGPCPPAQYEPSEHRYIFTLYALDTMLGIAPGSSKDSVVRAMQGHVLGTAQLIGKYKKK